MRDEHSNDTDRAQAYTLEGFVGSMVVLMAVLFALQSVVITPTTGGLADRQVQAQIEQEAQDALLVANQEGNLSEVVRRWDGNGGFEGADQPPAPGELNQTYSPEQFANESDLGQVLKNRFSENGWNYNVELHGEGSYNQTLVYQGSPPSSALSVSYTVTLYDDQQVTSSRSETLEEAANNDAETIPRKHGSDTPLYNVIEVRVILW